MATAMGRRRQPQIRERLLDACTDHALEHGLPSRLGPLAAAAGTSNRMLIYHFGTRDGLLREILGQARRRQVEAFTDLLRLRPDERYTTTLARTWPAISWPHCQPYLRLFVRLHDTAGEPRRHRRHRTHRARVPRLPRDARQRLAREDAPASVRLLPDPHRAVPPSRAG